MIQLIRLFKQKIKNMQELIRELTSLGNKSLFPVQQQKIIIGIRNYILKYQNSIEPYVINKFNSELNLINESVKEIIKSIEEDRKKMYSYTRIISRVYRNK